MAENLGPQYIKNTYQKVVQVDPSPSGSATPRLYDLGGNASTSTDVNISWVEDF